MNEKMRLELALWENHMSLKRVLIVDDAMDLGRLYQDALRTLYEGVPVTFVPSAEEALLETSRYTFDLMIADIRLPGMSGFDLVRKLRARQPNIKVIMITGMRKDAKMDKEFFEVGAQKLLVKPVSIPDFLDTVREVVGDEETARAVTAPLDKPAAKAPTAPAESGSSLSAVLTELRGTLGAQAAILLDDRGKNVAEAGNWPTPETEAQLVPPLMGHMSTSVKVSAQLGQGLPRGVQAFRGSDYDLLAAPVGSYALLVFLKPGRGTLRLALGFEETLHVQERLADILKEMGLNIMPEVAAPQPVTPVEEETAAVEPAVKAEPEPVVPTEEELPALQALEELLGKAETAAPAAVNLDDFWEQATSGESKTAANGDALTYEQALKLGLLPDEDAKS